MSTWKFEHEGSEIAVVNSWNGEKLFVNRVLQDEQVGMASIGHLYGSVKSDKARTNRLKFLLAAGSILDALFLLIAKKYSYLLQKHHKSFQNGK